MDEWLTNLLANSSNDPPRIKINRAKPADLVEACFTDNGTVKIPETQSYYNLNTTCNQLYPPYSSPRQVAGGPLANNILKCQLKPIDLSDYTIKFTSAQLAALKTIFPTGVCDWTEPGVEQQRPEGVWISFGP